MPLDEVVSKTMYHLNVLADEMKRQKSEQRRELLSILTASGISDAKALKDFYNSL